MSFLTENKKIADTGNMATQNCLTKLSVTWIYIVSIFFYLSCGGDNAYDNFSFHALDKSELSDIERKWYSPKKFYRKKKPVIFYENENLWYCYQVNNPSPQTSYTISLSRKHHGWLEVEVERQNLNLGVNTFTGELGSLNQGRYLLQVFAKLKLLHKIQFDVFPNDQEIVIDYDNLDIIQSEEVEDDIMFYSK